MSLFITVSGCLDAYAYSLLVVIRLPQLDVLKVIRKTSLGVVLVSLGIEAAS